MCQRLNYQSYEQEQKELVTNSASIITTQQQQEINTYRSYFQKMSKVLIDIVKVRKSILERKIEEQEVKQLGTLFLTDLKQELFELDLEKMSNCLLPELQNNLFKFRALMDKIDSYNFNTDLVKNVEFDPVEELEIEEIKKVSKMKEFLRNYKYIMEKQNNLIGLLTRNSEIKYDPQAICQKVSLLTIPGLEQQKKYLEDQEQLIAKSNSRFVSIEKRMDSSFNKLTQRKNELAQLIQSNKNTQQDLARPSLNVGNVNSISSRVVEEFGFGAIETLGMNVNFRDDGDDEDGGFGFGDLRRVSSDTKPGDKFVF